MSTTTMPTARRKLATELRQAGHTEAALALLLDEPEPTPGEQERVAPAATSDPRARGWLTAEELGRMTPQQISELGFKEPELYRASMRHIGDPPIVAEPLAEAVA